MADRVWVLDSSAVINLKRLPVGDQLDVSNRLVQMTERGLIAFPEQVVKEVCDQPHADIAGAFLARAAKVLQHPRAADYEIVGHVLDDDIASLVVPADSTNIHHADAYVLALAIQLQRGRLDVTVVADDQRDKVDGQGRLIQASIWTACQQLDLAVCTLSDLLSAEGLT